MRNIISVVLLTSLLFVLAGCNINEEHTNVSSNGNFTESVEKYEFCNEELSIYSKDHEIIGSINHFGGIIQTKDSIIYTAIPGNGTDLVTEIDYYRYIFSSKKNIKLGSIKNWSQQSNETVVFKNNVFLLVITGDPSNKSSRTLKLINIDLTTNSMEEVFSEKGGFPYNSMVGVGNKLLIAKVLANGSCVDEYDLETRKIKTVKSFDFNDETTIGETVRQIAIDGDDISLMMLVKETADSVKLRIDTYDNNWKLKKSIDVSGISAESNELKQGITNFEINEKFFYYENFSITRFLGKADVEPQSILDTNETFTMVSESEFVAQNKLFYQSFDRSNAIYLLDRETGELKKANFFADDEKYYIINMSRNVNGNILLVMYYSDSKTRDKHPARLYYISIEDLNFKKIN